MVGLVLKNADGSVKLDMTSSISQTTGSVVTGTANGAATIPAPPAGRTAFFVVVPLVDLQKEKGKKPGVTLSGTTLSWVFSYATTGWGYFSANCQIYYGYF
jgi:hypothetical protein